VKHVVVGDPVPSSTCQNDGIHLDQYILTRLGRSSQASAVAALFAISLPVYPPVSARPRPTAPRTRCSRCNPSPGPTVLAIKRAVAGGICAWDRAQEGRRRPDCRGLSSRAACRCLRW
jgi:hypothetical protein